jgi:hypothetical protein
MSLLLGEERKGGSWFPRGGATGGCNDAAVTDSRSRGASRLTRDGRQTVGQVGPNGCLVRYYYGDQTDYGMGWEREILRPKENCEEKFEYYILNKKIQTFE